MDSAKVLLELEVMRDNAEAGLYRLYADLGEAWYKPGPSSRTFELAKKKADDATTELNRLEITLSAVKRTIARLEREAATPTT